MVHAELISDWTKVSLLLIRIIGKLRRRKNAETTLWGGARWPKWLQLHSADNNAVVHLAKQRGDESIT